MTVFALHTAVFAHNLSFTAFLVSCFHTLTPETVFLLEIDFDIMKYEGGRCGGESTYNVQEAGHDNY